MARPYPTRNAALLDSFLEHKIENERLMRKIAELRQEENEDQQQLRLRQQQAGGSTPNHQASMPGPFPGNDMPMFCQIQAHWWTDAVDFSSKTSDRFDQAKFRPIGSFRSAGR